MGPSGQASWAHAVHARPCLRDGAPPPVIRADEEDSASTALSFHKLVAQTSSLVQACKRRRTRSPAPPLSSVSQCIRRATAEAGISLPHGSYGPIEAGAGAVGPEDAERQLMPPPPPRGVARTRKPKGPPRPRSRVSAWGTSTSASSEDAAAGRENETPRPAPSRLALLTLSRASTHAPVHPPAPAPAPARAVGADDESTSGGGVDLGLNVLPHAPSEPEPEPAPAPAPASVPVSASASVPATTPAPNPVSAYVSPSTPSPAPAPSAGVEAGSGSEADGAQRLHVLPQKPEAPTPSPAAAPARTAEDSGAARGAKRERTVPVEREMNEAEAQWIGAFSNVARAPRWRRLKAEGGEDEEEKGSAMSSGDAAVPSSVLRLRAFSTPARRGAKRGGRMPRGRKAVGAVVRRRVGDSVIQGAFEPQTRPSHHHQRAVARGAD